MGNIVLISAPEVLKLPIIDNNEGTVSLFGHPKILVDRRKQMANEQYGRSRKISKYKKYATVKGIHRGALTRQWAHRRLSS